MSGDCYREQEVNKFLKSPFFMLKGENMSLPLLILRAKQTILDYLYNQGSCKGRELGRHVIDNLAWKERMYGEIVYRPVAKDGLAFIMAYKELETDGEIKIVRPKGVPFPMTDYETTFELNIP
jgi:hypothetical protein